MASAAPNIPEFGVGELSLSIRRTLEGAFGLIRVRGEVSGFKRYASGHGYFDLKDAGACLAGVMWAPNLRRVAFQPEDGLEVIATGRLSTYGKSSRYQLVVERLEVAGIGALLKQIEERRRRLEAEGLFDRATKPPPPYLPTHIGIVTSPSGAVIRDILHRLADRCPRRVTIWPVPVQGDGAAARIAAAIAGFNARPEALRPDLLILARGGGSIEDLMAFNDEGVVRAAAASRIPLVSAVGHETDTTLIDFASARRAPTPTAAAEMAVPVRSDLLATLGELALRAVRADGASRRRARERLDALLARLPRAGDLAAQSRQRLDLASERLPRALSQRLALDRARLERTSARLAPRLLRALVAARRARLQNPAVTPNIALVGARVAALRQQVGAAFRLARSLSPEAVLERGYALVETSDGLARRLAEASRADRLVIRFADGRLAVTPGSAPTPQRGAGRGLGDQGRLL